MQDTKDSQSPRLFCLLACLSSLCYILPPLFHLNIGPNEYALGFLPLRIINADLKFIIVMASMSLVVGVLMVSIHLVRECVKLPKMFLFFLVLFIFAIFISTIISHNTMRAWVSSLQWHVIPLLFALSLAQIKWSRKSLIILLSLLIFGGVVSCLVTLDQHYRWTDWSHQILRENVTIPAGIIFNHNFAAEYHALLIPLTLGLFFYLRNWWFRCICLFCIFGIFLPAVSLSMARGAWVGHIGNAIGVVFLLLLFLKLKKENPVEDKLSFSSGKKVLFSFLLLGLSLPVYLYTSNVWKKDGGSAGSTLHETVESKELKSVVNFKDSSIGRRFVLWEDAFRECFSSDFLFGKGTDHYELFFHESAQFSDQNGWDTLVRFVHNDLIQTFYENGIVGIVGWLGIWGFVMWKGLVCCIRFYRNGESAELGLRLGLLACIICFLIEALFEFPTRSPCAMFVGWSALGILFGLNLQSHTENEKMQKFDLLKAPKLNLAIGVIGVVLPFYICFLGKDLFWANVYHFQGRAAADAKKPQLSLHFHQESIDHAPWQHLSRKAEGYLLITQEKRFLDAMKSIEKTLEVHPGCLQAHQNRIALLINEFKNLTAAKIAFADMKKAAPYHRFTKLEEQKLTQIFEDQASFKFK
jgi:O-antigen ligase